MSYLKVEHELLPQPRAWRLPEDRDERDHLIHHVVIQRLRTELGEVKGLATFTELDEWDGPLEDDGDETPSGAPV